MQKKSSHYHENGKHAQCATPDSAVADQRITPELSRRLRIIVPTLPSRLACLTDRKSRAARHATEFALWQASGGDFLRSSLAAEFIRVAHGL